MLEYDSYDGSMDETKKQINKIESKAKKVTNYIKKHPNCKKSYDALEMIKNPKMNDEMIEQAMTMTKKYFLPFAIGGTIIASGFLGLIGSLIGAAVAKKKSNPFENQA
jgi:hypothetical protein